MLSRFFAKSAVMREYPEDLSPLRLLSSESLCPRSSCFIRICWTLAKGRKKSDWAGTENLPTTNHDEAPSSNKYARNDRGTREQKFSVRDRRRSGIVVILPITLSIERSTRLSELSQSFNLLVSKLSRRRRKEHYNRKTRHD